MKKLILFMFALFVSIMQAEVYAGENEPKWIEVGEAVHVNGNSGNYYLQVDEECEYSICAYNANQCDTFLKLYEGEVLLETADDSDGRYGKYGNFLVNIVLIPGKQYTLSVTDDLESGTGFVFAVVKKGSSLPEYDGKIVDDYVDWDSKYEDESRDCKSEAESMNSKNEAESRELKAKQNNSEIATSLTENETVKSADSNSSKQIDKSGNNKVKTKVTTYKLTKKKLVIRYKKVKSAVKYEIRWSNDKKFKKVHKLFKKGTKFSININKHKKYYVTVRPILYRGKKMTKWSKIKKIVLRKL
ncbi:MAG: hypothetical protein K6G88_12010 [Lachnospiraceae bacterium]|nr:hypothetical protein [Lachnospiraceae bacterium]